LRLRRFDVGVRSPAALLASTLSGLAAASIAPFEHGQKTQRQGAPRRPLSLMGRAASALRRLHRPAPRQLALAVDAFEVDAEAPQARDVLEHLLRGVVQRPVVVLRVAQRQ
jgi:hypothetical protein